MKTKTKKLTEMEIMTLESAAYNRGCEDGKKDAQRKQRIDTHARRVNAITSAIQTSAQLQEGVARLVQYLADLPSDV